MARIISIRTALASALAASALGLTACAEEAPTEYETDVVDESGGELIVEDANPEGVDVELPETPMTPVAEGEAEAPAAEEAAPAD